MKSERKQELKDAILTHIANAIREELQDWDNLEEWLSFDFINDEERDEAAAMFELEARRLYKRID